jgi:hypothetical protein
LENSLTRKQLPLEGKVHRALDDARNIAARVEENPVADCRLNEITNSSIVTILVGGLMMHLMFFWSNG